VRNVAVQEPLSQLARLLDHIVALPGPDVHGVVLEDPGRLLNRVAVGINDLELAAVNHSSRSPRRCSSSLRAVGAAADTPSGYPCGTA
jgi:hypothetical protein